MDVLRHQLFSSYQTIAVINDAHKIYLVQHQETGKIFVKKILDVYNAEVYAFLKEHPILGIPRIVDFLEDDGQLVVIEEYISGQSLSDLIRDHALTTDTITKTAVNLCEIMEKLHGMDPPIIHRDIKPSNILVLPYGQIILLDFNAAKQYDPSRQADTVLLGTQGYAAPEQYGFGSSSPQTDIYATGILLKELAESLPAPTYRFDAVIKRCTQLEPSSRYRSFSELKGDLLSLTAAAEPSCANRGQEVHPVRKTPEADSFLPPGYRTKNLWKMALASVSYLLILWLCLTLEIENTTGSALWVERVFILAIILSIIASCFNYRNIQRFVPLCGSQNRLIHYLGILLLAAAMSFFLFIMMFIVEDLFHMF